MSLRIIATRPQSFKDMMLVARRDTEAAEEGTGATLASIASNACASADTSFNLPALDSMFAELATGVGQGGWEVQTNKGFFCHETKMVMICHVYTIITIAMTNCGSNGCSGDGSRRMVAFR